MLQNEIEQPIEPTTHDLPTRIGDVAAMLRVMRPLDSSLLDPASGRRQLLADLCRFIGVKVGTLPVDSLGPALPESQVRTPSNTLFADPLRSPGTLVELSPRLVETLKHLLDGDSEKQVARKLRLSQHTVHVYVKALYRRFGVGTRAELLAKHLHR